MKPSFIYQQKPISVDYDLFALKNHIIEISVNDANQFNTLIEIRDHFYKNFDGTRYMDVSSVWFDDKPVMIIRKAGRYGKDQRDQFVTDRGLYVEMLHYIVSLNMRSLIFCEENMFDAESDIESLNHLYGYTLDEADYQRVK